MVCFKYQEASECHIGTFLINGAVTSLMLCGRRIYSWFSVKKNKLNIITATLHPDIQQHESMTSECKKSQHIYTQCLRSTKTITQIRRHDAIFHDWYLDSMPADKFSVHSSTCLYGTAELNKLNKGIRIVSSLFLDINILQQRRFHKSLLHHLNVQNDYFLLHLILFLTKNS